MNPNTPTDLELYRALQRSDTRALGVLYDRYGTLVYRLAFKMLGAAPEAEDLTQEIFLTLWQKRNYDPQRGSLSSFLMTMTRSRSIDRLRSRGSNVRFLQRIGLAQRDQSFPNPLEQASLDERSAQVKAALETLSDPQRQVLELAYFEGLSQSEIAERLQTPLGTIKTRGRQALLKLKGLLFEQVKGI